MFELFPHPSGGKMVEILILSTRNLRPEKHCVGGSIPPGATLEFLTINPSKWGLFISLKSWWKFRQRHYSYGKFG